MVMFSQDDNGDTIRRAVQAGVSAYVVDGLQANRVRPILDAAIATFDEYRRLQGALPSNISLTIVSVFLLIFSAPSSVTPTVS